MSNHRTRLLAMLLLALGAFALTACNTMEGMGEDISSAGDGLSGAADDANPDK